MRYPSVIADYMREASCSIEAHEPLRSAERLMEEQHVRELPVCQNGRCCGVIRQADLRLAARNRDYDAEARPRARERRTEATVGEAMSDEFYPVMPTAPLAHVVRTMAAHGYHYAVVIERDEVKGIFTTTQALGALSELLEQQPDTRDGIGPGDIRAVILTEHSHVRSLLERARAAASAVREPAAEESEVYRLRHAMERLLSAMSAHVDLEDRALAPALTALPGYGKERAEQLVLEHRRQTSETRDIVQALAAPDQAGPVLASKLQDLIDRLETGLSDEEALLLNLDLLRNDGIVTECNAG